MSYKTKLGWILLSGASIAAVSGMTPAFAQESTDATAPTEEIVVTATGRQAAIQDVPIAVQAINSQTLEQANVQSLSDLTQLTPTLTIGAGQSTTSGTIASIRGIGTGSDNPGFEAAVGIFVDGVYRARSGAALADLPEVNRIEILRGPQGTLFGKNTSAGAISVVTAGPSQDFSVWGEAEGGQRNLLRSSFGLTGGITPNLALRLDASIRAQDGYITDVTSNRDINDTNRWSLRGQALWDINDDASLRIIADAAESHENCCGAVNIQSGNVVGQLANIYFPGALLTDNPEDRNTTVSPNRDYAEVARDRGISGELDWNIGNVQLTSITAYRNWISTRDQDVDFSSVDRAYRDGLQVGINNTSEELRLQGDWGRVNWLVGAFVSRENLDTTDRIRFGNDAVAFANAASFFLTGGQYKLYNAPVVVPGFGGLTDVQICGMAPATAFCQGGSAAPGLEINGLGQHIYLPTLNSGDGQQADNWRVRTDTISAFTHEEINLTDNLVLTVGARFTHETKDMNADLNSINAGCATLQNTVFLGGPLAGQNTAAYIASLNTAATALFAIACNPVTNTLANGAYSDNRTENEWSGVVSLSYHLSDDLMLYSSYSRGYKAGGFNLDRSGFFGPTNQSPFDNTPVSTAALQFKPEFTNAYEIGFKSTLWGHTYLNADAFYEQIEDYQDNAFSGFNFFTLNVPELVSKGVEIELNSHMTENLSVQAGILYDDAYFNSTVVFGDPTDGTVLKGTQLDSAPLWTLTGAVNYRIPLGGSYGLNLFVDGRYVTDYPTQTIDRNPITDNSAFAIFDARISFGPNDHRWSVEAYAQNLTDQFYYVGAFGAPERGLPPSAFGGSSALAQAASNYYAFPNAPRTVGVTVRVRY